MLIVIHGTIDFALVKSSFGVLSSKEVESLLNLPVAMEHKVLCSISVR